MTPTELLVAERLLTADPDALLVVEQWMTERYERFSFSGLKRERDFWMEQAQKRVLTGVECLIYSTVLTLIAQAEAEE